MVMEFKTDKRLHFREKHTLANGKMMSGMDTESKGMALMVENTQVNGTEPSERQRLLTNASGDSYNGYFKDDQPDGEGTHTKADG